LQEKKWCFNSEALLENGEKDSQDLFRAGNANSAGKEFLREDETQKEKSTHRSCKMGMNF
jgi:hypothetical protein